MCSSSPELLAYLLDAEAHISAVGVTFTKPMAKSLRSSIKKGNKARLRSKVFGPVEDARTERLSAKLLELAASAKPVATAESTMDIDKTSEC